ncbi:hypothetical protein O2K51_11695 [Apibacter raozihei]|uniref:hypothetical protein n=1 Tax=Apibacter raozihei TaxID=2500547 RepID=UPI000FE369FA|nr:hypothetical protein [Apibacter raozihei]
MKYEIVLFSGILSIIFNGKIEDSNTLKKQKSLVNEGSFFVQEQKNEEKVDFNQEKNYSK